VAATCVTTTGFIANQASDTNSNPIGQTGRNPKSWSHVASTRDLHRLLN
jgi:hypothetical protein